MIVVAVAGFVIASGGGDDDKTGTPTSAATTTTQAGTTGSESTETTTTEPAGPPAHRVTVAGGKPQGGIEKIKVGKGDRVKLVVKSDVADEIHIHGYDLTKDVAAGGSARFDFKATIDGSFEIELEERGEPIASLTVEP